MSKVPNLMQLDFSTLKALHMLAGYVREYKMLEYDSRTGFLADNHSKVRYLPILLEQVQKLETEWGVAHLKALGYSELVAGIKQLIEQYAHVLEQAKQAS